MKILYQHRTLADGAEGIHIAEMVEAFEALGHTVVMHALTTTTRRGEGRPSFWGRLKAALPGPIYEAAAVIYNVVDYWRFRAALRAQKPDLVYKRHALYDAGIVMACRHEAVPIVLEVNCPYSSTRHQSFERVRFPSLARLLERYALTSATLVATVSSPLGALLADISDGRANVLVVPNGANPTRFRPLPVQDELRATLAPTAAILVGWAGILRPWHRVELLFEAVVPLSHLHVVVIGDGPDRARLETVSRNLGVESRVHFTGRVSHEQMPAYIAALDVAVAADDRTGYASPMKLLEYMAMAKPVVAPRLRNVEDFILDGDDGVLFEPGSAADFSRALSRLADDPALRHRCGANARLKIERERNWVAIARCVLDRAASDDRSAVRIARVAS